MLYGEIIAVYSESHTKHINTTCVKYTGFFFRLTQVLNRAATVLSPFEV
jgi:hypothetical protein